jgi:hypothetical protein
MNLAAIKKTLGVVVVIKKALLISMKQFGRYKRN